MDRGSAFAQLSGPPVDTALLPGALWWRIVAVGSAVASLRAGGGGRKTPLVKALNHGVGEQHSRLSSNKRGGRIIDGNNPTDQVGYQLGNRVPTKGVTS